MRKVSAKQNQYRDPGKNQHFSFARVDYHEEFVVKHYKEANFYSCDDINMLRIGPATAVSRYHQQFHFFMTDDGPNLNDHDFPNPGYLLVPSGYLLLTPKEISEDKKSEDEEEFTQDIFDNIDENHQPDDDSTGNAGCEKSTPATFRKVKLKRLHYPRLEAGPGLIKLRACKYDMSSRDPLQRHFINFISTIIQR